MLWKHRPDINVMQLRKLFSVVSSIVILMSHTSCTVTTTHPWGTDWRNMSSFVSTNISFIPSTLVKDITQRITNFTSAENSSTALKPTAIPIGTAAGRSLYQQVLIGIAFGMLSIVTIVGNLLVFIAFYKNSALRTITNYFILSLAASDLLIGIFSINFYASFVIFDQWYFGPYVCDAWLCMDYTCCQASVFNLVTICIDRYLSLTHPLTYRAKRTSSRAKKIIALIWVTSFLEWSPMIVCYQFIQGKRTVPDNNCYIQFLTENAYLTFGTALLAYYIPVTLMGILYWKIYKLAKQNDGQKYRMKNGQSLNCRNLGEFNRKLSKKPHRAYITRLSSSHIFKTEEYNFTKPMNCIKPIKNLEFSGAKNTYSFTEQERNQGVIKTLNDGIVLIAMRRNLEQTKRSVIKMNYDTKSTMPNAAWNNRKAAKMISVIILAFFITWLPYDIFAIMMPFCALCIPSDWWSFGYAFCYCNSTINPFCYALGNKTFARTFRSLVARRNQSAKTATAAIVSTHRMTMSDCDTCSKIGQNSND